MLKKSQNIYLRVSSCKSLSELLYAGGKDDVPLIIFCSLPKAAADCTPDDIVEETEVKTDAAS